MRTFYDLPNGAGTIPEGEAFSFQSVNYPSNWLQLATDDDLASMGVTKRQEPVPVTADDVRREAQRRIIALTGATTLEGCLIKQLNASMRATTLVNKKASAIALTEAEQQEAAALEAFAAAIEHIRVKSNAMEGSPPADYRDDSNWA